MSYIGDNLPQGWVIAKIDDLFATLEDGRTLHQGWSPQCEKEPSYSEDEWAVLKTTAIQAGVFFPEYNKRLPSKLTPRPQIEVKVGDLLLTCAGPRIRCGIACLVRQTRKNLMMSGKMYRFRMPDNYIESRYLEAFLQSEQAQDAIGRMKTGGNESGLNLTHERFRCLEVPIAPLNEQRRIADKYEELLSDLDSGVAELKAAQKKLAQYRQSLLKAVVEGELTAEWRKKNKPNETGAKLLERILKERRARWEEKQLARFKEQGKTPPKGWQDKYPEPVQPDTANLPELPEGWVWASGEQLCDFITKGTTPPKGLDLGIDKVIPFLRVTNLTDYGELDLSDKVFVSKTIHEGFLARSVVYPGDVLMNIVGPPLGQVSVVPNTFTEWNINQAIAIFRAVEGVMPGFVSRYLLSPLAQQWLKARSKTTAGQTNLTLEVCRSLPFPLPPTDEQQTLVSNLDAALESIANQSQSIEAAFKQSAAQRKNILKSAFSGQLVPQDPNDEPASVLLERIRAERQLNEKTGKSARKTVRNQ